MPPLSKQELIRRESSSTLVSVIQGRTDHNGKVVQVFDSGSDTCSDDGSVVSSSSDDNNKQTATGTVALYVNNESVYPDGSPAHIPAGQCVGEDGTAPAAYVAHYGCAQKASSKWQLTQEWREAMDVWQIHTQPNPWYYPIKAAYPRNLHGMTKDGHVVVYEQVGQMNTRALFKDGCTPADLVRSASFTAEYMANHVVGPAASQKSSDSWGVVIVMDCQGAGLSTLKGDNFKFIQEDGSIYFDKYYQMHLRRLIVINAPRWLSAVWAGLKSIIPDCVEIQVATSKAYPAVLRKHIDEDQIPPQYSGTSAYDLGQHPYQRDLEQLVDQASECVTPQ